MKKKTIFSGLILSAILLGVTSCEKTGDQLFRNVGGTYLGSISKSTTLNGELVDGSGEDYGIAEVTTEGNGRIRVHCYGNEIDTTFHLDIYAHYDNIFVCQTGADFERMYGHMLGGGHNSGGMMGHMGRGETDWMHHMNDEHDEGDEHFGAFNMVHGSFSYSLNMMDDQKSHYLNFYGVRE